MRIHLVFVLLACSNLFAPTAKAETIPIPAMIYANDLTRLEMEDGRRPMVYLILPNLKYRIHDFVKDLSTKVYGPEKPFLKLGRFVSDEVSAPFQTNVTQVLKYFTLQNKGGLVAIDLTGGISPNILSDLLNFVVRGETGSTEPADVSDLSVLWITQPETLIHVSADMESDLEVKRLALFMRRSMQCGTDLTYAEVPRDQFREICRAVLEEDDEVLSKLPKRRSGPPFTVR